MTINCKGTLLSLETPIVMGILNITPDSFFDGGQYTHKEAILQQVSRMLGEGATIIDVGAYSSRPGAAEVSEKEELNRLIPVLELLLAEFPEIILSVDTFRSEVAKQAVAKGAAMINDISGGTLDPHMFQTIASLGVPYIVMHMQGTPQTMQNNPSYKDITYELLLYFSKKIAKLKSLGIHDVIIDVGFGFGKSLEHNYTLLNNLDLFKSLEAPILTGVSRKSMLYKPLDISPKEALNATTVAHTIALLKGSHILRVHDVKEAVEAIKIIELLKS